MNTIAGAALRASLNRRLMRAAPRPANISTNDEADWAKNSAPDSLATALAKSVLPVPGGPWRRMPFGTRAPRSRKRLGSWRKSTTSRSSSLASSAPATSLQPTEAEASGLICCGLIRSGMLFRRKIITTAIRPMKMIGSQMTAQSSKPDRNEPSETTFTPIGHLRHGLKARIGV